jgi:hypothetical protein
MAHGRKNIKLHKCVLASSIGHNKMFQSVLQEAPSTDSCSPDGLRTGQQTENQCLARDTLHSSSFMTCHAADIYKLLSSVQLWA